MITINAINNDIQTVQDLREKYIDLLDDKGVLESAIKLTKAMKKLQAALQNKPNKAGAKTNQCFSKPGWWQTLCGKDSSSVASCSGWTDKTSETGCKECKKRIAKKDHIARKESDVLNPDWVRAQNK